MSILEKGVDTDGMYTKTREVKSRYCISIKHVLRALVSSLANHYHLLLQDMAILLKLKKIIDHSQRHFRQALSRS